MMIYIYKSVFVFLLQFICSLTECPANCDSCQNRYPCIKCYSSYFLNYGFCTPCVQNCEECVTYNNCTQCKHGFYGLTCKKNCSLCSEGLCDLNACKHGCINGYYEKNGCYECRSNCEYCESFEICNVCKKGYYLREYNGNFDCMSCSQYSCHTNCEIANCRICKVENHSKVCTGCKQNYKYSGGKCVPNVKTESKAKFLPSKVTTFTKTDTTKSVIPERTEAQKSDDKDAGSHNTDSKLEATSRASTQLGTSEKRQCEEKNVQNISFFTAYISGLGSSVVIAALIVSIYCTRRRFVLKKARTDKKSQETTEMTSYYNVSANDTHTRMTNIGENSYESLRVDQNTDKVYSELETQTEKPTIMT